MPSPTYLRALQAAILALPACAQFVHDNEAPPISGADAAQKDAAIADLVNASGWGAGSRAIPVHLAKKLLIKRGRWRGIVKAAADDGHPAVGAAYAAVALAEDARMDADFLDQSAGPLLTALVSTGLIDSSDREALEALSRTPSQVSASDVSRALRGPWGDE